MAGDVELNPGPGKCEYTCFAGSCVNVVLTAAHLFTVKTQETHETSLSTDPDRSRAVVLNVFRKHYFEVTMVISPRLVSVTSMLYSMDLLSEHTRERVLMTTGISNSVKTAMVMDELDAKIRADQSPYQLLARFCYTISDHFDVNLISTIMQELGELLNVT